MAGQRGRPKQYDAETALQLAGNVFWSQGYSGTSLDDLAAAMGMNRPSIYRAFGGKEALYRQAMGQFAQQMEEGFNRTIEQEADMRKGLSQFYRAALNVYGAGDTALGCMVICTAPAAAWVHPDVQADLLQVIEQLDAKLLARVEQGIRKGQISSVIDAQSLSKLIQAVLHSLAVRVRAGESKASLERFSDASVAMLLGPAPNK